MERIKKDFVDSCR